MKLLQFLFALCVIFNFPAKAAQFGDFTYTATTTAVTITGYTGTGGMVTIPETIDGLLVTSIGRNAFESKTSLNSVTIPNSITSIEQSAFFYCTGLTSVTIGSGVTSIGGNAFDTCTSLTSVTIPNSVTSIGSNAFQRCSGLTSVTIPNSVTSIGNGAFNSCSGLRSIYSMGNAPLLGVDTLRTTTNTLVYYVIGTVGWTSTFGGLTTVALGPPIINEQPFSVIANLGESIEFSVLASSSIPLPLSYQWKRNGITIQGATTATLSISFKFEARQS